MTTPPQDEYTSKLAETLERVRKIEVIPQMRGEYVGNEHFFVLAFSVLSTLL